MVNLQVRLACPCPRENVSATDKMLAMLPGQVNVSGLLLHLASTTSPLVYTAQYGIMKLRSLFVPGRDNFDDDQFAPRAAKAQSISVRQR